MQHSETGNTNSLARKLEAIVNGTCESSEAVDSLVDMLDKYPYFVMPATLLLKNYTNLLTDSQRRRAETTVAIVSSDSATLYRMTDRRAAEFENFYPAPEPSPEISTNDAIDTFLRNYGNDSPEETQLLERLIFNPVPDYASVLSSTPVTPDNNTPQDETLQKINAFIETHSDTSDSGDTPQQQPSQSPQTIAPDPNSLLSESLAKIFIKQRRYDKAYEIISQLSLNYPEKSCYFADQLRFLRKLIINEEYKK